MKTILLSGAAGFIGVNYIINHNKNYPNDKIIAVDRFSDVSNGFTFVDTLPGVIHTERLDLSKEEAEKDLLILLVKYNVDYVIHMAASSSVDASMSRRKQFVDDNVLGTFHVLESFKSYFENNNKNSKLVVISTDEVSGHLESEDAEPFTEESPIKPRNIYSSTKASAELLSKAYILTFDLPIIITRCCNVIGKFQHIEKVLPRLIMYLKQGKEFPLYGNGSNIREFAAVEDKCDAIDFLLENGKLGEVYNIGTEFTITNRELVNYVLNIINKYYNLDLRHLIREIPDPRGKSHDFKYESSSAKLRGLGWRHKINPLDKIKDLVFEEFNK